MSDLQKRHREIIQRPEELVYRSCYAPIDLARMLANPDERSLIRRLPAAQVFFAIKALDDETIARLLPQITEEQWTTVLDLDLWRKDRVNLHAFLGWQRHLLDAEDAVARKLVRATDLRLWQTLFRRFLEVYVRVEEDEFESEPVDRDSIVTPDGGFIVGLPRNPEASRVCRSLLARLYELDADWIRSTLLQARLRTPSELEEDAYQNRRRRIEDLGFQDYFDAIEVYSPLELTDSLPEKRWEKRGDFSDLPEGAPKLAADGPMLLFQAMSSLDSAEIENLVEELFFVCNKLLSADRVSPESPRRVKHGIRKALSGINLGLSCWSEDQLGKAAAGLRRHFLVSFFQLGFGRLVELRTRALRIGEDGRSPEPGSFAEACLEGLQRRFPVQSRRRKGRIRRRPIDDRGEWQRAHEFLEKLPEG